MEASGKDRRDSDGDEAVARATRAPTQESLVAAVERSAPIGLNAIDLAGRLTYTNRAFCRMVDWTPGELLGLSLPFPYWAPEHIGEIKQRVDAVIHGGVADPEGFDATFRRRSGERFDVHLTIEPLLDGAGAQIGWLAAIADISERRRLERDAERLIAAISTSREGIAIADERDEFVFANTAFARIYGGAPGDVVGKTWRDFTRPEVHAQLERRFSETLRRRDVGEWVAASRHRRLDGAPVEVEVEATSLWGDADRYSGHICHLRDVSDHRRAADERIKLRKAVEASGEVIWLTDREGTFTFVNPEFTRLYGHTAEDVVGKVTPRILKSGLVPAEVYASFWKRILAKETVSGEITNKTKDGRSVWIESSVNPILDERDEIVGFLSIQRDITERRRAEKELREVNWALKAIGRSNAALVHAGSEQELIQACCDAVTSEGGYALAWVGFAKDDAEQTIEIAASAGQATSYLDGLELSWGLSPAGQGAGGEAIRSGHLVVKNDMMRDPSLATRHGRALRAGLAAAIALPFRERGRVIGIMCIYSRDPEGFGSAQAELFEELAEDLGYGLESRRMRTAYEESLLERERQATKVRDVLETAIAAIAATVEKRDPYTAGHERRVAHLAVAIARDLGLDEGRIEGLHLAGIVHDIGKVQVPAEILSKPSRLLPIEFELIKLHPQAGYEILKDIAFPWPIADIVRQHHEYLDGSGYPLGISGEQILREARIMTVADIVEAMASHRPYRPGLGIDAALEQVQKMRGTKLDAAAVDACVRLFRERGYKLPD